MSERRAVVVSKGVSRGEVEAYLPDNYHVEDGEGGNLLIVGEDHAGWTLQGYVLPRLQSGLIVAREVGQ